MSEQIADPALGYQTYTRGDYTISTDPARLDAGAIFGYLSRSYWATPRPRPIVELSLRHSLNFGLYHTPEPILRPDTSQDSGRSGAQVGLARIITDYATFAYLCDVYVLEEHRGHGLGKWLIETMINDPALALINRIMLATRDAHSLYAQYGFTPPSRPEIWMERLRVKP